MKKMEKLAALVLAMVMVFSFMAVTAAAYGAEEHEHTHVCSAGMVQPRMPAMECPKCKGEMDVEVYEENGQRYLRFTCRDSSCGTVVSGIRW